MDSANKPIKRSPLLVPLSREHHEGLLLAWKIRQGIKKNIQAERIAQYCVWFHEIHLKEHFQKEETEFAVILGADDPLYVEMIEDHKKLRHFVSEFEAATDNNYNQLQQFAALLNAHIRFEERVLFNYIELNVKKEKLEEIFKEKPLHNVPYWNDEFWLY